MSEALNQLVTTLFHVNGGSTDLVPSGVIPTVFSWITSTNVLPFFAIGIGVSLSLVGIKIIRSVVWGA